MRISQAVPIDPVIVGLATWVMAELGFARHIVPLTRRNNGNRFYNPEAIEALRSEGVLPDSLPNGKGRLTRDVEKMFKLHQDGFFPDPNDPAHLGTSAFWGKCPAIMSAVHEGRKHNTATA